MSLVTVNKMAASMLTLAAGIFSKDTGYYTELHSVLEGEKEDGLRPSGTPRSFHHLPPPGVSPLNRTTPTPQLKVSGRGQRALVQKHKPKAVKKCPPVKKSAARPHSPDYSKPSFRRPQERGLRVWYDEDKDNKDSSSLHPPDRKSRHTDHLAENSLVPHDEDSPCLPPPPRRSRHTKLKLDHRAENEQIPVFASMSLEDASRSAASDASVAAAGDAVVASDIQGASSKKVQECSRKRKLEDLKQELSNKQRKVEASRLELQATIDRKLKELKQGVMLLKQEVTERERKQMASFKVNMDTQSGRRKVWRRKQGNSSTQKTPAKPRPLKRLPDNSQHPGRTEAASQ